MASSTSDSLPSSPSLPTTAADQEFSSHHHRHSLFLPASSSSSPSPGGSLYLDSSFHGGLLPSASKAMSSSPHSPSPPPPLPPTQAPAKPAKKRPRASRRPPTTVLTTDTSNFRAMVQEFTGFPAPPFAPAPPPAVRPRLLGGPPSFLMRPSPIKYPVLLPPTTLANNAATMMNATDGGGSGTNNYSTASTSSLVDALALFAKSNAMPAGGGAEATPGGSGGATDHYHGISMGGFNPFDDFDAAAAVAEGEERGNSGVVGDHGGFFSSSFTAGGAGAGDKYGRH